MWMRFSHHSYVHTFALTVPDGVQYHRTIAE